MLRKILHIDDDAGLAALVKRTLSRDGCIVFHAISAEEGLRKVKQLKPALIILDMSMPGPGGGMVIDQLTGEDGSTMIPVLLFTAYDGTLNDDLVSKAAGVLKKPCDVSEINAAVDRILPPD